MALALADGTFRIFGASDGLTAGPYYCIYEDPQGVVWLGGEHGLSKFVAEHFTTFRSGSTFPAERLTAIISDDSGALWIGTNAGIVRIAETEIERAAKDPTYKAQHRVYDRSDGLAGLPLSRTFLGSNTGVVRSKTRTFWFATTRGLTIIDPREAQPGNHSGPVLIDRVQVDGQQARVEPLAKLPARTHRVEIDYSMLELGIPSARFRYRLEGLDTTWIDAGMQRQAVYKPDRRPVRFRVMASNAKASGWSPARRGTFRSARVLSDHGFAGLCALALASAVSAWRINLRRVRASLPCCSANAPGSAARFTTLLQSLVGVALQCDAMANSTATAAATSDRFVRMRKQVEQ